MDIGVDIDIDTDFRCRTAPCQTGCTRGRGRRNSLRQKQASCGFQCPTNRVGLWDSRWHPGNSRSPKYPSDSSRHMMQSGLSENPRRTPWSHSRPHRACCGLAPRSACRRRSKKSSRYGRIQRQRMQRDRRQPRCYPCRLSSRGWMGGSARAFCRWRYPQQLWHPHWSRAARNWWRRPALHSCRSSRRTRIP